MNYEQRTMNYEIKNEPNFSQKNVKTNPKRTQFIPANPIALPRSNPTCHLLFDTQSAIRTTNKAHFTAAWKYKKFN